MLPYRNKKTVKYCWKFSDFGVSWEQKDSIFSPKGLWTYLSWLTDLTLAFLAVRLFNLLGLVRGILQKECRTLLLTSKLGEFEWNWKKEILILNEHNLFFIWGYKSAFSFEMLANWCFTHEILEGFNAIVTKIVFSAAMGL